MKEMFSSDEKAVAGADSAAQGALPADSKQSTAP
jgi:hypothetical protein